MNKKDMAFKTGLSMTILGLFTLTLSMGGTFVAKNVMGTKKFDSDNNKITLPVILTAYVGMFLLFFGSALVVYGRNAESAKSTKKALQTFSDNTFKKIDNSLVQLNKKIEITKASIKERFSSSDESTPLIITDKNPSFLSQIFCCKKTNPMNIEMGERKQPSLNQ